MLTPTPRHPCLVHASFGPGSRTNNKFIMAAYQSKAFVIRVECVSDSGGGGGAGFGLQVAVPVRGR